MNTWGYDGSLRATLIIWGSPMPGSKRILGGPKVQLGPGVAHSESKTCFLQLLLIC